MHPINNVKKCSGITISVENGVHLIRFDQPNNNNAISVEAYDVITRSLKEAREDEDVRVTVLTGTGSFYSSGFDITGVQNVKNDDIQEAIRNATSKIKELISTLIDYPKLLVAMVNGPAFGIAVTTLALCDVVYASNTATFRTPFTSLGLCSEGCSSYTFPRILGTSKATEMLLLNGEMSSTDALKFGLVSELYEKDGAEEQSLWKRIGRFAELPPQSLAISKRLIRRLQRDQLHAANALETSHLERRMSSEEFMVSILRFLNRKNKSKL